MADESVDEVEREQDLEDEEEPIRLPAGWGPIIFLAAVVIASNVGLGLYLKGVMATNSGGPIAMEAGAQHGPPPGAVAGGPVPVPGVGPGRVAQSDFQVDPAGLTPELDAYLKQVAAENGIPEDQVGTAREVFEEMSRSGLLPRNSDLDLRTILSGHLVERAKHPEELEGAEAARAVVLAPPGSVTPGMKPPEGAVPQGMKPPEKPKGE